MLPKFMKKGDTSSSEMKCKHCGSSQTYFRIKTNDDHCKRCGNDNPRESE